MIATGKPTFTTWHSCLSKYNPCMLCYGLSLSAHTNEQCSHYSAEPILYHELDITSEFCCAVIDNTVRHHPSKPPNFFVVNVKAVRVSFLSEDTLFIDALRRILVACPGTQKYDNTVEIPADRFIGFGGPKPKKAHTLHVSVSPPKHLTLSNNAFPPYALDFSQDIFTNVTHLCLRRESEWTWGNLASLRHLTHLRVHLPFPQGRGGVHAIYRTSPAEDQPLQRFLTVLPRLTRLKLVILDRVYTKPSTLEEEIIWVGNADMRAVICYAVEHTSLAPLFEAWTSPHAIPNMPQPLDISWQQGETKVDARRRSLIEVSREAIPKRDLLIRLFSGHQNCLPGTSRLRRSTMASSRFIASRKGAQNAALGYVLSHARMAAGMGYSSFLATLHCSGVGMVTETRQVAVGNGITPR